MNKNAQELAKNIQNASAGMRAWQLFDTLVSLTFHATASTRHSMLALDPEHITAAEKEREKCVNAGVRIDDLAALLEQLADGMSTGYDDFLGDVAAQMGTLEKGLGQFFTPSCAARLLSQINTSDIDYSGIIRRHGYVTAMDPTCGSGGLLLRFAERMRDAGHTPRHELFVEGTDIETSAWKMAYVQLSFRDIPARLILGDCLTQQARETIYTPAYHRMFVPHQRMLKEDRKALKTAA